MDVFPTAYFGSIGYIKSIVDADHPVIELNEHFIKQTHRSRCEILGPNDLLRLSIPVKRLHGSKTAVKDILIADDTWRSQHWKSIETAYNSSAYFDYYGSEIEELLNHKESSLWKYNQYILERVFDWLDIDKAIQFSDHYIDAPQNDYRTTSFESDNFNSNKPYTQVFKEKHEHINNLSILDLILNQGPMARNWIITP